jgi:hypothetical protein
MDKSTHYQDLKSKWLKKHREVSQKLLAAHSDVITSLIPKQHLIGGLMLASVPFMSFTPGALKPQIVTAQQLAPVTKEDLASRLKDTLPAEVQSLNKDQEDQISKIFEETLHIKATAELEGIMLNRGYGLIGQEQHLRRFPEDTIYDHFDTEEEARLFTREGMAPGLGAWGYFAQSKQQMTNLDKDRERYYIAVQTFLSPGWGENVGKYGKFFKYRKMLIVNPENGKVIVANIADAGPAEWTGKHLGGSPEVMHYLERVDGAQRGPVIYFFIDDPSDTIPLGPINL